MSSKISQPINKNFLSRVGFKFGIKKLPNTNFFVQSVNVPGRKLGYAPLPNPFKKLPIAGDHLEYNDFAVTFKVDEDFQNYIEIYNWMNGIGFPDSYEQHRRLVAAPAMSGEGIYSDGTLLIYSSSRNPSMEIVFTDMFPHSISDLVFDSRDSKIEFIEATVIFKFAKMQIKRLTGV